MLLFYAILVNLSRKVWKFIANDDILVFILGGEGMKKKILDSESYSPLYRQLMQKLRSDIASGVYPVHSRIPSEQELCDTYQVSRVTVRKALAELTQEELLKRHQARAPSWAYPASARI